ncbi:MAG: chloride channel protein [Rikenellaceae bacterium]|nr:chloride channel protein [Rikenellaceae bacterium]
MSTPTPNIRERIYTLIQSASQRLSGAQMMAILAVIVGLFAGVGAYVFNTLLHFVSHSLTSWTPVDQAQWLYLVYPGIGIILATLFVKYIVKDGISEGVTRVLYAMSRKDSRIAGHNCWSSIVGGATTIGFGGSVGPEAPIVLTGAALGSNVGKFMRLNYKNITLLLCCGAGAAVAAIFKAPITGVVFVIEILMLDITSKSIIPLLLASVTATITSLILHGFSPIIAVTLSEADMFQVPQIPLFVLLGCFCGIMAYYFTSVNSLVGGFYNSMKSQWRKWLYAGVSLGVLIFIFPPLYGEGHDSFGALMSGETDVLFNNTLFYGLSDADWFLIVYLIAVMLFKVITMATTNAAGGVGGTFAPSLFVGAFAGASLAVICRGVFDWDVSITSFTLVGMAGVMSGVMKAPLTSIFLIAELSNGYGLFIPLMIVSGISFAVNFGLDRDSIYTKQLRMRGELLTHDKDSSAFVFLRLDELMETDFIRLRESTTLGDVVNIISSARRNIFPVVDNYGKLLGIVQLDDLRHDMFNRDKWGTSIMNYMIQPPDKIESSDSIQSIMPRFEQGKTWMLPVVDNENHYKGFISKSRILNAYREALVNVSQAD